MRSAYAGHKSLKKIKSFFDACKSFKTRYFGLLSQLVSNFLGMNRISTSGFRSLLLDRPREVQRDISSTGKVERVASRDSIWFVRDFPERI
jgi:hypothetical protein